MEFIRGLHNVRPRHRGCAVTIGNFDGLHLGHQSILDQLRRRADDCGVPALVTIFEPQPQEFFAPDRAPARLTSLREKVRLLSLTGIEYLLCLRFDAGLAGWSAEEFVQRLLIDELAVRAVIVGDDFRFGRGRGGDFAILERLGRTHGFEVTALQTCYLHGERVSSSRVRAALAAGDLARAAELLGRPYSLMGRVIHGDKRGRGLGMPTLNIDLKRPRPAPAGVFVTRVHRLAAGALPAISYIGRRPVFGGEKLLLETHVLDYAGDCYGRSVEVELLHKLRDEQRFTGSDELRRQMRHDLEEARKFLEQNARQVLHG